MARGEARGEGRSLTALEREREEEKERTARLWCGSIVSQLVSHARVYIFTEQKVVDEGLYHTYRTLPSLRSARDRMSAEEQGRLAEVDDAVRRMDAALKRRGTSFASLAHAWGQSRVDDAHLRVSAFRTESGETVEPTDDLLVPFILDRLAGKRPFAQRDVLDANLRAVLGALHELAAKNGADENPFELY